MSAETIAEQADALKNKYAGLNLDEICGELGIVIRYHSMGQAPGACKGFFIRRFEVSCIMVNADLPDHLQRVILAHEMGHACLHAELAEASDFIDLSLYGNNDVCEYEANMFAAEMLLSDEDVLELIQQGLPLDRIAGEMGVPKEMVDYKARILEKKGYPVRPVLYADSSFLKD
ncbi:MAG: ImmA/IrrE family metallo-endopeptidase [Clostridia bacterium]|nr:ImmA/IrrE family metallo-endopeptidase [Clostridia bacterium]